MQSYNAVTNSRAFWQGVLMIVDYDEHGGFFDHVTPPLMPANPPRRRDCMPIHLSPWECARRPM